MELVEQDMRDLGALAGLYNAHVADTPFCYPVEAALFVAGVAEWTHPEIGGPLRDQTVLVARERGEPLGFIHIAVGRALEGWGADGGLEVGCIRFIAHPPGRRDVGETLLTEAQARLREMGATPIHAFAKTMSYRFYQLGFGMLPVATGHITGLLGSNGYAVRRGEFLLEWRGFEPIWSTAPDTSADITVARSDGGGRCPT